MVIIVLVVCVVCLVWVCFFLESDPILIKFVAATMGARFCWVIFLKLIILEWYGDCCTSKVGKKCDQNSFEGCDVIH